MPVTALLDSAMVRRVAAGTIVILDEHVLICRCIEIPDGVVIDIRDGGELLVL